MRSTRKSLDERKTFYLATRPPAMNSIFPCGVNNEKFLSGNRGNTDYWMIELISRLKVFQFAKLFDGIGTFGLDLYMCMSCSPHCQH